MGAPAILDAALKRLFTALGQLEAAGERLDRAANERRDLEDTLSAMQDDRGRLAEELDVALAGKAALEQAAGEVARRLSKAGTTLRMLLDVDETV